MDPKEGRKNTTHDAYVSALLDEFRLYDELLDTKSKKIVGFGILFHFSFVFLLSFSSYFSSYFSSSFSLFFRLSLSFLFRLLLYSYFTSFDSVIDIGGGTPSIVSNENIEKIMNAAKKHFNFDPANMEVSLETTPRIAASDPDKIKAYPFVLYSHLS